MFATMSVEWNALRPRFWLRTDAFVSGVLNAASILLATKPTTSGTTSTDDEADLAAIRLGDSEAFRRIVERHQAEIALQMRRFTRDSNERDSLVHDVFVEVFVSLSKFHGRSPFEHWLRKIAVRVGYRFWKRRERQRRSPLLSSEQWSQLRESVAEPLANTAAAELVHDLLAMLSPPDRLVLTLIYLDGCSMSEAAERAGWTTLGTKVRASRARQKLRDLIEQGTT